MNIIIKSLPFLLLTLFCNHNNSTTFDIHNNCDFTVWAAAVPGGGQRLDHGQTWRLNVPDQTLGRIWGRTSCYFNATGEGKCLTGDSDENSGSVSPNTVVRYKLNPFNNLDFLDISLINGFNLPIRVTADTVHCTRVIHCLADINEDCPRKLRVPQGCSDPCAVFKTDE